MAKNDSNSDSGSEFVERGKLEKDKVSNIIFKKRKLELETFFQGYRSFIKTENKKSEEITSSCEVMNKLFKIFFHELDKTLSQSQKDFVAKKWKPHAAAPIMLLNDPDQLADICKYLNSLDMARISVSQEKLTVDLRMEESSNGSYKNYPLTPNNAIQTPLIQDEILSDNESTNEYYPLQDYIDNSNIQNENLFSVKDFHAILSEMIEKNNDISSLISNLKVSEGYESYKKIIYYCENGREPIHFQLAMKIDMYENILTILIMDDILDLTKKNFIKINIFSYLLMNNIDRLYQFLKFTKKTNLMAEVRYICSHDIHFKAAFSEMKEDIVSNNQGKRMTLMRVDKFCFH